MENPNDLKVLNLDALTTLSEEIRDQLIDTTSVTGGHLAPNLGVVELTLGIYRALDAPPDMVTFDVGHQSYIHKLITGRRDDFDTLRTYGGMSGFPNRFESPYDLFGSGHASDSLSISLGYSLARQANHEPGIVACVIGDGAIAGGMAWEALSTLGHLQTPMIVVLNDNEMSISRNVGAISSYLGQLRLDRRYTTPRDVFQERLERSNLGTRIAELGKRAKESVKQLVVPGMMFEELGLAYVGPIDGHDILQVEQAVRAAKESGAPVVIHAVTQKGRGFEPAENDPTSFHGIGCFDKKTGVAKKNPDDPPTYTDVFAQAMVELGMARPDVHAITAAMACGTGLDKFADAYPDRFWDLGITEGHTVGFSAGLALGGKIPVCTIYSTFLQRAFDQLIGDVALQQAHVVFALDRGGFVGDDGPTHHGVFDMTYLRSIPTMQILAPSNEAELVGALRTAVEAEGPIALRYPRGKAEGAKRPAYSDVEPWAYAKMRPVQKVDDAKVAIVAAGRMVAQAIGAADLLKKDGIESSVIDARWVKPLDEKGLLKLAEDHDLIVTVEENTECGGFGAAVLELFAKHGVEIDTLTCAIPDKFATQGSMDQLIADAELDSVSLARRIAKRL
ncbi:MAG: 1-deoxy-D-xylulose-5-phosphate synthase [Coriobacteriia bacterium]|nr:1-deoxy-D-xylulose-5-phosphate synthase [Coriobacteriia bacterium]